MKDLREKFTWLPGAHLEIGMYDEAARKGIAFGEWLESLKADKEGSSPYRGMTQMEIIMAKMAAKASGKAVVPTAFDELLWNFDIQIGGAARDKLSKFFNYSDSTVLMGEYISQVVAASLIRTSLVQQLVAVQERTNASSFMRTYLEDDGDDLQTGELSKDQELPDIWIKVGERSMPLIKYGRYLKANFDDVDNVSLNAFNISLGRIGQQIGVDETSEAIRIAVEGDGNSNAASTYNPSTTDTLNTTEVITIATKLETPYQADYTVAKKAQNQQYLAAVAGISSVSTPSLLGSVGVGLPKWIDWNRDDAGLEDDYILILDSRYCLGNVSSMAVFTESERLVKKQIKGTGIWYRSAHYKLDNNACYVCDVDF